MDEVMADTLAEHLRRYNQTFDEDVTPGDLVGKGLWEVAPLDRQQQLRAFLDAEDFFEDLALMPGAQEVLKQLSVRFEVFIATQAMTVPNSLGPKYRWLQRHFPFIPPTHYVFCGNKSILRADYLIDDLPRNLLRGPGPALHRPPQPHRHRLHPRQQLAGSCRLFHRRQGLGDKATICAENGQRRQNQSLAPVMGNPRADSDARCGRACAYRLPDAGKAGLAATTRGPAA
jgi:5'(3')-deoxyribonucleotidase